MKRILYIIILLVVAVGLASCDKDKEKTDLSDCTHSYVDNVINESTCTSRKITKTCLACGNVEVVSTEPIVPHNYSEGICTSCQGANGERLNFALSEDGAYYIVADFGKCTDEYVAVPQTHNGLPVKEIGSRAFYSLKYLKKVILPEGITVIGKEAFFGCSNLSEVLIPNTVTKIEDRAFYSCQSFKKITIPSKIEEIGEWAFYGCTSAEELLISEGVKMIGDYAFSLCESIEEVTIPKGVEVIGKGCFKDCKLLKSVYLPSDITTIPENCFRNCGSIYSFSIPSSVLYIEKSAFENCQKLSGVTIPDNVVSIGEGAFKYCKIRSLTIGKSVTSIGKEAFYSCLRQEEILLPENLLYIGEAAFKYCHTIRIEIPASVVSIGDNAFYRIYELENINVDENNRYFKSIDGVLYSKDGTMLIKYPEAKEAEEFTIPDDVITIKDDALMNETLKVINIGKNTVEFSAVLFSECPSLISINIDEENEMFCVVDGVVYSKDKKTLIKYVDKEGVNSFSIPDGTEHIGGYAFYNSAISKIQFPDGLISIGEYAFYGVSNVRLWNLPDTLTAMGAYAFYVVRDGFWRSIVIPKGITKVGSQGFDYFSDGYEIFFRGSFKEWTKIGWLTSGCVRYYSERDMGVPYTYWHYDENGDPVYW